MVHPLKYLGIEARRDIAKCLDIISILANDYRLFGEKIGFTPEDVQHIAATNKSTPTLALLKEACTRGVTIEKVQEVLKEMKSRAADVIPKYMNDVRRNMKRDLQQQQQRAIETRCSCADCAPNWSIPARVPDIPRHRCGCPCHSFNRNDNRGQVSPISVMQPVSTFDSDETFVKQTFPIENQSTSHSLFCSDQTYVKHTLSPVSGNHLANPMHVVKPFIQPIPSQRGSFTGTNGSALQNYHNTRSPHNNKTYATEHTESVSGCGYSPQQTNSFYDKQQNCSHAAGHGSSDDSQNSRWSYPIENQLETYFRRTNSDTSGSTKPGKLNRDPKGISEYINETNRVFLTYSFDAFKEMLKIKAKLEEKGIPLKYDLKKRTLDRGLHDLAKKTTDKCRIPTAKEWIETELNRVRYILVLVSPQYKTDITPNLGEDRMASPDDHSLNTRFIHEIMTNGYSTEAGNRSKIIPIVLQNLQTKDEHIPNYMKKGVLYDFPSDFNLIHNHIING
ncbi:hypothetical protein ScPMuIL_016122 [Solemya velum]